MIHPDNRSKECYVFKDGNGEKHVGYRLRCNGTCICHDNMCVMVTTPDERIVITYYSSLQPMPTKDITSETRSTSLDAKPGTWESVNWKVPPEHQAAHCMKAPEQPAYQCTIQPLEAAKPIDIFGGGCFVPELQLAAARDEANDLMQRLTESQQEVAKLMHETQQLKEIRDHLWSDKKTLEHDNGLLERDRDEARQELAEVKAERDRLAAQVDKWSQENERQRKIYRQAVARNERLESRLKQIKALAGG